MNRPKNNDPMSVGNAVQGASNEGGDHLAAPLGPITGGRLEFVRGASNVTIHADLTTKNLYRARFEGHVPNVGVQGGAVTIRYPRFPLFDRLYYRRERPAEVALNASIPWDIEVRDCASRITADLRGLKLGSLNLGGGASRLEMMLPRPSGTVPVRVLGRQQRLHPPSRRRRRAGLRGRRGYQSDLRREAFRRRRR